MESWMSSLPDNKKLVLTNIPGTHNSAAYNMNYFGSVFSKCQDLTIMDQLKAGKRKFDLRITSNNIRIIFYHYPIFSIRKSTLICWHGICDCYHSNDNNGKINLTLKNVLLDMKRFLEENLTEIIICGIASNRENKYHNLNRVAEIFEKNVGKISVNSNRNLTIGNCRRKIVHLHYKNDKLDKEGKATFNSFREGIVIWDIHKKIVNDNNYATFKVDGNLKIKEIEEFISMNNITFTDAEKDFEINIRNYPFRYSFSCTGEFNNIIPLPKVQTDIVKLFILNYDLKKGNYYG